MFRLRLQESPPSTRLVLSEGSGRGLLNREPAACKCASQVCYEPPVSRLPKKQAVRPGIRDPHVILFASAGSQRKFENVSSLFGKILAAVALGRVTKRINDQRREAVRTVGGIERSMASPKIDGIYLLLLPLVAGTLHGLYLYLDGTLVDS